jgi:hypothetical protein
MANNHSSLRTDSRHNSNMDNPMASNLMFVTLDISESWTSFLTFVTPMIQHAMQLF